MTIQRTIWSPDTCGCRIEYSWDDSIPQEERVHSVSKIIKACQHHESHPNKEIHYEDVMAENQSKNKAIGKLIENYPELKDKASEIMWRMSQDRSVIIILPDEIKNDKDLINNEFKDKYVKKVIFE